MEYNRTELGFPSFSRTPGGSTPKDWPSQYGILASWSIMMWQVSPVALGPTIRFVDTTFPVCGVCGLVGWGGVRVNDWICEIF